MGLHLFERAPRWALALLFVARVGAPSVGGLACADENNMCPFWAEQGECEKNPSYMLASCKLSCKRCTVVEEVDVSTDGMTTPGGVRTATASAPAKNPLARMPTSDNGGVVVAVAHEYPGIARLEVLWRDDGTATTQRAPVSMFSLQLGTSMSLNTFPNHVFTWRDAETQEELGRFRILPSRPVVVLNGKARDMFAGPGCVDKSPTCPDRAKRGECSSSPGWMITMCGKSCDSCHLRDPELRCARSALDMTQRPAIEPGDLEARFRDVAFNRAADLGVTVHSAPEGSFSSSNSSVFGDNATAPPLTGPWVVTLDNFVSDEEADAIVASVSTSFSRSTDQGRTDAFGEQEKVVSQGRTSENAWCTGACETSPATRRVMARIQNVTGVPTENYESFQVLRYLPGQYYRAHHDMSGADNTLACGPRIYTFFLYLSDVEEGGETEFPSLRDADRRPLKIRPKRGTALWWPSVQSDDPTRQDPRTRHAALPVSKGTKFAANAWIHNYDYATPNLWGCTGSFD